MNDQKLIQFYYNNWGLGSTAFCREKGIEDVTGFNKFLNGGFDHARSREVLRGYWEDYQKRQMLKYNDIDDNESSSSDSASETTSPSLKSSSSSTSTPTSRRAPQETGRRGVRNLLKNYYGASIGEGGDAAQIVNDPMNIDAPSFNLQTYFDSLVKTSTLPQLIAKDNEMVSEIRTLDGDMKTLVYENYTKFINATDIIKKMKSNVENMEESMEKLSRNMDRISGCSEKINSTLAAKRDKIDQLSGLQKLLQKLQYLTALPSSLKDCLEMQLYSQAVKYYNSNSGILKQYAHIPSFQNIQNECDALMKTMKGKLYDKLGALDTDKNGVMESCEILMELLEPVEAVRSRYLDGRKKYLSAVLNTFQERSPVANIIEFVSELDRAFLSEHLFITTSYRSMFINRVDGSDSTKEKKNSLHQLDEFTRDLFGRYLAIAKVKLSTFKNPKEKIEALEIIYKDVLNMNKASGDAKGADKGVTSITDIINSTVNDQISYYFENLQNLMKSQIHEMNKTLIEKDEETAMKDSYLWELSEKTMSLIVTDITDLFNNLKPFFIQTSTQFLTQHYGTIFTKIQVKLQQFFLFLGNIHFLEYLDTITLTENKEEFGPRFLLLLCNICLLIESKGIPQVVQMLNDFLLVVKQSMTPSQIQQHDLNSFQAFNQPDLSKRLRETSQRILSLYTKLTALKFEKLLRKGLETNWLKSKEPKDVRSVMELYLDQLSKSQQEIQKIFKEQNVSGLNVPSAVSGSSTPTAPRHARNPSLTTANSGATQKPSPNPTRDSSSNNPNQSQLFDKKSDIYNHSSIEFNWKSILTTIVKLSMKSYNELLRTKTFGTNGFHQIVIDNQFLKQSLIELFSSQTIQQSGIDSLLDQCEVTINERCTDTVTLSPSLKKIVDDAIKNRKEKLLEQQQ